MNPEKSSPNRLVQTTFLRDLLWSRNSISILKAKLEKTQVLSELFIGFLNSVCLINKEEKGHFEIVLRLLEISDQRELRTKLLGTEKSND